MKQFAEKQQHSATDVLKALNSLEDAKATMKSTDPLFKTFILRLNDAIRSNLNPETLEAIAIKAYSLNIKDTLFWFSLDNIVKTSQSTVHFQTLLVLFSIFLRVKSYPQFFRYAAVVKDELLGAVKENLSALEVRHIIHACYVFASFEQISPDLIKRLKGDINASLKDPNSADISINELSTAALLISTAIKDSDSERGPLLKNLGQYLSQQDLTEFCGGQKGEAKGEEDYKEERLTWQSIAFLVRVYYTGKNQNAALVKKLNEAIIYKAEIDPVDFESASILLSILSDPKSEGDKKVIKSLIEAVQTQLVNEGAAMFSEYDGRNVTEFLRALINLAKNGHDNELIAEFLEYFEGLVASDKIATKIELEDYIQLKTLFGSAKGIGNYEPNVFEHIQRRVDYINEQKSKEQKARA